MTEALDKAAMEIILYAGNGRDYLFKAVNAEINNSLSKLEVNEKLKNAELEIQKAHRVQTEMIQDSIEGEYETTLLFAHAQDTLMTIYSELHLTKSMVKLIRQLRSEIKEEK